MLYNDCSWYLGKNAFMRPYLILDYENNKDLNDLALNAL